MRIRRNDQVVLLKAVTGAKQVDGRAIGKESKGSVARVLRVIPETNRIVVEGVNYVHKHVRRSAARPQGGRILKEASLDVSNVMLYCPKCNGPAKFSVKTVEKAADAEAHKPRREKMRICKRCGEAI